MKKYIVLSLILVVLLKEKIKGVNRKNPGNIKHGSSNWFGKSKKQTHPVFVSFDSHAHGIRAMGVLIDTYKEKNVRTIREIISRWAPGNENDTEQYIKNVSTWVGVGEGWIPYREKGYLEIIKAIIKQENGLNPYSDKFIIESIKR